MQWSRQREMVSTVDQKVPRVNNNRLLGFDPHKYTTGRWLRNDEHQRQMRRIDLNFDKLCQKIVDLSQGSKSIKNCEKQEGGFNRVFIFTMDDNSRVVARLPFSLAGPAKLATASEVATIQYCVWKDNLAKRLNPR